MVLRTLSCYYPLALRGSASGLDFREGLSLWGPRGFLILGESVDQNVGVIERRGRESRGVLDQA